MALDLDEVPVENGRPLPLPPSSGMSKMGGVLGKGNGKVGEVSVPQELVSKPWRSIAQKLKIPLLLFPVHTFS